MFGLPFFRKRPDTLAPLFGDLVAAARMPEAFVVFGVTDDFEGRFERLVLVATLVMRRLRTLPAPAGDVAQELVDRIFAHLDDGLRRSGIGDLSVPKRMKKLAQGFYGRADVYTAALDALDETALRVALARNLLGGRVEPAAVHPDLLAEIASLNAALSGVDLAGLLAGSTLVRALESGRAA